MILLAHQEHPEISLVQLCDLLDVSRITRGKLHLRRERVSLASVVGVAAGLLLRVDVGGWDEFGEAVGGDPDLPLAVVDDAVMMSTQEDGVVEVGGSVVEPAAYVMAGAPPAGTIAGRKGAAAVAEDQGAA